MRDELLKYGNKAETIVSPEARHMVPRSEKNGLKKWLLQRRRKRPDSFSYVADTDRHRGTWGLVMRRDPLKEPNPRFDCRIDGATVYIDSKGTDGLDVQLGSGGLGLTGEVKVIWNGVEAYAGAAEKIKLGIGARRSWRRR